MSVCWTSTVAYDHIMLKTPVLVRSPQLSNVEPGQYLDGWPPGNTGCCRHFTFFFLSSFLSLSVCIYFFGFFFKNLFCFGCLSSYFKYKMFKRLFRNIVSNTRNVAENVRTNNVSASISCCSWPRVDIFPWRHNLNCSHRSLVTFCQYSSRRPLGMTEKNTFWGQLSTEWQAKIILTSQRISFFTCLSESV